MNMLVHYQYLWGVAGGLLTFLVALFIIGNAKTLKLVKKINERDSHKTPTPRGAGIGFAVLSLVLLYTDYAITGESTILWGIVALVILTLLGLLDDLYELSAELKLYFMIFVVSILIAQYPNDYVVVGGTQWYLTKIGSMGFMLFLALWWVNLYNFMDGINGIAIIQALSMIAILWFLHYINPLPYNELYNANLLVVFMGLLPILWLNLRGRIFLGDVGSLSLGLMMAFLVIGFTNDLVIWAILPAVFWVDASLVLIRRILRRQNPMDAHRSHTFQILSRQWASHAKVSLAVGAYNIFYILPVLLFNNMYPQFWIIWVAMAIGPIFIIGVKRGAGVNDN